MTILIDVVKSFDKTQNSLMILKPEQVVQGNIPLR